MKKLYGWGRKDTILGRRKEGKGGSRGKRGREEEPGIHGMVVFEKKKRIGARREKRREDEAMRLEGSEGIGAVRWMEESN